MQLTTIQATWEVFLRTPFNGDMAQGKVHRYRDVRDALRSLAHRKRKPVVFPPGLLRPLNGLTLGHMLDQLIGQRLHSPLGGEW